MKTAFKIIGAVTIVALTLAAVAKSSAQTSNLPDQTVCRRGLNMERTGWVKNSFYAEEAARRGLTVDACRQLVAQIPSPPPTSNSPLSINGGTRDQRAFLEAAVFFITGVDTTKVDMVTNREIVLGRYPIVAYLVDSNPCAVRIRTTTKPYTVWQMDFCKITHYQRVNYVPIYQLVWVGQKSAFCVYRGWN